MGTPNHCPARAACPTCGGHPRWESLVDADEERWLAVCRCGRMQGFLPDQPEMQPEDPLSAFLSGVGRTTVAPASPPWIRLFLRSLEESNAIRWRYCPTACAGCGAAATFEMRACPRPFVLAICTLCLACGHVTAAYLRPSRGMQESPATGGVWAPPCPAVQRLRDCVFRPYARLAEGSGGNPTQWIPVG